MTTSEKGPGFGQFIRAVLRRMVAHRGIVISLLLTSLVGVAFSVLLPLSYKILFDNVIPERNTGLLWLVLGGIGALFLLNAVCNTLEDYLLARLAAKVLRGWRTELFKQFQAQGESYFRRYDAGDLLSRFTEDLQNIERLLLRTFPGVFVKLLTLSAGLVTLFVLDWRLALVSAVLLPVSLALSTRVRKIAFAKSHGQRQSAGALAQIVHEDLSMHRIIRIFGLERYRCTRFDRAQEEMETRSTAASFFGALTWRISALGVVFTQILVMGFGVWLVFGGHLTVGGLVAFFGLLTSVSTAVAGVAGFMPEFIRGEVSYQRLEALLAEPVGVEESSGARSLPTLMDNLRFQDVTFGYTEDQVNIQQLNLVVRAGQSVAFVGPSGAGKSTVLNLVLRLYDPQHGQIVLDGTDLRKGTLDSLRSQIAVVPQDTSLFKTTVRENIRMGRLDATDEEVMEAAREAEVHETIMSLPNGYDTDVGEGGNRLSGGQRQRIAMARALVRNPKILLLDEATSALDPETEAAVNRTLDRLRHSRTVLTVTHRLATIQGYDRIAVINSGRLAEIGSHNELLTRGGIYNELWQRQSRIHLSDDGVHAKVDASYLGRLEIFQNLDSVFLQNLADQFETEFFRESRVLFDQGDVGDKFFIVARGTLDVEIADSESPDCVLKQIATLRDGDWFGEIALLRDVPRVARVRARTDSICLALHRSRFRDLLADRPELREKLDSVVEARLAENAAGGLEPLEPEREFARGHRISPIPTPDLPKE